ncbi:hypothetical protein [Aureimonas sp. AU40]|uniref:hypothetical protein n=1 Tax=Aureimonas sp. AU40 TaxID=1637747 RepID=UPI000780A7A5|nr:hypothetical protein [Aureimonas sp. AU40]
MNSRRIEQNAPKERREDNLKHLAGVIGRLSFREMRKVAETLSAQLAGKDSVDPDDIAVSLLETSDKLNAEPAA